MDSRSCFSYALIELVTPVSRSKLVMVSHERQFRQARQVRTLFTNACFISSTAFIIDGILLKCYQGTDYVHKHFLYIVFEILAPRMSIVHRSFIIMFRPFWIVTMYMSCGMLIQ